MKVKICGITRLEDGLAAAEAGADLLGFNFYPPSPRYLEVANCRELSRTLRATYPALKLVGVFVNESVDTIQHTLDSCELDAAQLTGDEKLVSAALSALRRRAFPALRLSSAADMTAFLSSISLPGQERPVDMPAVLIDAHAPGAYGGTGQLADWNLAASLATQVPTLLAGGLTPDNVRAGIQQVKPWGVDVASGVESVPGIKDPVKVRRFVHNAKTPDPQAV